LNKTDSRKDLGKLLRQRRRLASLSLDQLATVSGVSPSYLGRIENGERFPSASILQKVAKPLGFNEDDLFVLAGFLSPQYSRPGGLDGFENKNKLDPTVASILAQEPLEVQKTVVGILAILKSLAVVTLPLRNPMITPDLLRDEESRAGVELNKS
jgi:transcriptional regulator with XRE-family HTH domain